jgi:hypothetical protein
VVLLNFAPVILIVASVTTSRNENYRLPKKTSAGWALFDAVDLFAGTGSLKELAVLTRNR